MIITFSFTALVLVVQSSQLVFLFFCPSSFLFWLPVRYEDRGDLSKKGRGCFKTRLFESNSWSRKPFWFKLRCKCGLSRHQITCLGEQDGCSKAHRGFFFKRSLFLTCTLGLTKDLIDGGQPSINSMGWLS